jgi:hypothetical protein
MSGSGCGGCVIPPYDSSMGVEDDVGIEQKGH